MSDDTAKPVAIVTGGESGIGAACARRLGQEGACVVVTYYDDHDAAEGVAKEVRQAGGEAIVHQTDVADEPSVESLFEAAEKAFGTVNRLVNSAGLNMSGVRVKDMELHQLRKLLSADLVGCFLTCRRFVRGLAESQTGRIVNISSIHEFAPRQGGADYTSAKGGLRQFTRTLALELAPRNIAVNDVAPGMILTPMNAKAEHDAAYREKAEAHIPWGRAGQPEEVAELVAFLLSEKAGYITGASMVIDGGLSLVDAQGA